mgnify:CR=1 FL=1|tara:strand:- start:3841 stop:4236 length:396 start_codon:yes stop_codon:yes gene_type:complete
MTTQSAISAQSFGTSTNVGNGKFSISPLTLAAGTSTFVVTVQVTAGAGPVDRQVECRIWYTTTIRTVTSTDAPQKLAQTARYVDIRMPEYSSTIVIKDSTLEPATGTLFHCWVDAPKLQTAATLSVDLVEL